MLRDDEKIMINLKNYASNNTSKTRDNASTIQHNASIKEARAAKLRLYFAFFVTERYILLFFLEIVNIVLYIICFNPFEYQGLIIRPSKILSRQGYVMSGAKLSGLPDVKLKTAIQAPKRYIYHLFRVLSTTSTASEN